MLNTRLILVSDSLSTALKDFVGRLENPQEAFQAIGAAMESRISARFETQTDPSGKRWAPLSPVTKAIYAKRAKKEGTKGHGRILDDSGDMLASLGWSADPSSVTIGFSQVASKNKDAYAVYHEFGAPKNHMPRRGLIYEDPTTSKLTHDDEQVISDIIAEALFT